MQPSRVDRLDRLSSPRLFTAGVSRMSYYFGHTWAQLALIIGARPTKVSCQVPVCVTAETHLLTCAALWP